MAEHKERDKKREEEMGVLRKQMKKLASKDEDKDSSGSGGGLVLASSKSEVSAEAVNTAASQAVRPVQRQVVRLEHEVQELTAFIASHTDPVLKDRLEDLNTAAVPVMKKHNDVTGWQERYMAVRRGVMLYARSYKDVMSLAGSAVRQAADQNHVMDLAGCSVAKCPEETDKDHYALMLTTSEASACRGWLPLPCCAVWIDSVLQGQQLLWSTSDATLRLAIMETVKRYCTPRDAAPPAAAPPAAAPPAAAPPAAAPPAAAPPLPSEDDDRRRLLLGASSCAPAAKGGDEDFA
jgi:hypothetical protein